MPRDMSDALPEFPSDEDVLSDWMLSLIRTMRADMGSDKLVPPGTVYIIVRSSIDRGMELKVVCRNIRTSLSQWAPMG